MLQAFEVVPLQQAGFHRLSVGTMSVGEQAGRTKEYIINTLHVDSGLLAPLTYLSTYSLAIVPISTCA